MARPRNHARHLGNAVNGLVGAMQGLLATLGAPTIGETGPGNGVAAPKQRGPGKGNKKLKSKLRSYWAKMTPAERKARIAKMHAWRKRN